MGKPKKVECASSEESSRQDIHPEVTTDTKNPSTTLYKTAVEAVAAPSGARYHVERPEEKDQIKVLEDVCNHTSHDSNWGVFFSKDISHEGVQKCVEQPVVEDNLPRGSYGEVSRHVDPVTHHKIASKKIRNRRTFNTNEASIPMMMRRVCQEELLRDSFVEILGIVKLTDTVLLLMTAVDVDLEGLIKTNWWCNITYGEPVDKVRLISGQVLQALEWMHKQGFGHLDIKPGNVGFNIDHKQVVIFDFGTARKFADGDVCTKQGMTRCYMAPELWQGVLNKKADVFAVGCLAYFLFHGKHMWLDEMMGSKTYLKELTIQHVYQKFQRIRYDTLRDLLISMCLPDTRMRLSAAEAHAFLRQLDIKDLPPAPTLPHLPDIHTAPESTVDNRWAEAELPHLTEFMPGDDQEKSLLEGDQDRPMDRRTSNTDGLSVAGQIPALSQLLSSDDVTPPQSVEGNQEEQALAGKDPQMHTSMQTSGFVTMDPNTERLDDEQHDAG